MSVKTADYNYALPHELIAQHPLAVRSDARLLIVHRESQSLRHAHVRDLPEILSAGDCLVFNDSRVIPARLVGHRSSTRGRWEGLFLAEDDNGLWLVLGKTRGKPRPGETITVASPSGSDEVQLRLVARQDDGSWIVKPETMLSTNALLEKIGRVPLPPYIRDGEMGPGDCSAYQTVFANHPGSVAAPTAGLHFTLELLERLQQAGVNECRVTLHVGLGTFRPITADSIDQHEMHSEWGRVSDHVVETLTQCAQTGRRRIAVGTTSLRLLESAVGGGSLAAWQGNTELFIHPPYDFRAIDGLMTNFHLPKSTLLVLVRTFGGDELIRRAYDEAIKEQYRFYSYGDAMLIL